MLGTMIGAGGGFLLVPLLVALRPTWSTDVITAYSLAVVAANGTAGTISYWRANRIDRASLPLFAAAAIPSALLGVWLTTMVPRQLFEKIFGVTLLAVAAWLFLRPRHRVRDARERDAHRELTDSDGKTYRWHFDLRAGVAGSAGVGFLSSLLGIGGGFVQVPFLVSVVGFPAHIATAMSHAVLALTAGTAAITHIIHGDYRADWPIVLATCVGATIGAPFGARISSRLSATVLLRILAASLAFVGFRSLFSH